MKKILVLIIAFLAAFSLSACVLETDKPSDQPEALTQQEVMQMISSLDNSFQAPNMTSEASDAMPGGYAREDGEVATDEGYYYGGCDYFYEYVENDDGSYTYTYSYYEYEYNHYYSAYDLINNEIDDDNDGTVDEDDEVLLLIRPEWTDGIDNNNNGQIDEYWEMTPIWVVTYTYTYFNDQEEEVVGEDGTVTSSGSYSQEWTMVKTPYDGQELVENCEVYYYDETGEPEPETDEEGS